MLSADQTMALEVGDNSATGEVLQGTADDDGVLDNTAIGTGSTASGYTPAYSGGGSTAIGYNSTASGFYSMASGAMSTADSTYSTASGFKSTASDHGTTASGSFSTASSDQSAAFGFVSTASGSRSTAIGQHSLASGHGSTTIGSDSEASGYYSTASGVASTASGVASTASGVASTASGSESASYGYHSEAGWRDTDNDGRVDPGEATVDNATSLGAESRAYETNATALGHGARVEIGATNSVALGQGSIANQEDTVSLGNDTFQRRIVNMADGVDDTDAVTVGQLNIISAAITTEVTTRGTEDTAIRSEFATADTTLHDNIAAEATTRVTQDTVIRSEFAAADTILQGNIAAIQSHNEGLSWTSGSAQVGASTSGTGSTAVGDGAIAFTRDTAIGYMSTVTADGSTAIGANSMITAVNSVAIGADAVVNEVGGTAVGQNASVATGATGSVAVGQDSEATEANTVSVGSASNQRRITNAADGVNANDVVTVQQLQQFATSSNVDVGRLDNRIDNLDERMDKVGALSMAIAQLSPNPRAQGDTSLSLGIGHYSGSSALAAAVFHHVNDNIMFKASITSTAGETGGGGGMTISW